MQEVEEPSDPRVVSLIVVAAADGASIEHVLDPSRALFEQKKEICEAIGATADPNDLALLSEKAVRLLVLISQPLDCIDLRVLLAFRDSC